MPLGSEVPPLPPDPTFPHGLYDLKSRQAGEALDASTQRVHRRLIAAIRTTMEQYDAELIDAAELAKRFTAAVERMHLETAQ